MKKSNPKKTKPTRPNLKKKPTKRKISSKISPKPDKNISAGLENISKKVEAEHQEPVKEPVKQPDPPTSPPPLPGLPAVNFLANMCRTFFDFVSVRKNWPVMTNDEYKILQPKADYIEKKYLPLALLKFGPEIDFLGCFALIVFSRGPAQEGAGKKEQPARGPVIISDSQKAPSVDEI